MKNAAQLSEPILARLDRLQVDLRLAGNAAGADAVSDASALVAGVAAGEWFVREKDYQRTAKALRDLLAAVGRLPINCREVIEPEFSAARGVFKP